MLMKAAGTGMSMYGASGGSFTGTMGGTPSKVVNGVPVPGTKPAQASGLFMDGKPLEPFGYQLARPL
jgi:hypothetical protein